MRTWLVVDMWSNHLVGNWCYIKDIAPKLDSSLPFGRLFEDEMAMKA